MPPLKWGGSSDFVGCKSDITDIIPQATGALKQEQTFDRPSSDEWVKGLSKNLALFWAMRTN